MRIFCLAKPLYMRCEPSLVRLQCLLLLQYLLQIVALVTVVNLTEVNMAFATDETPKSELMSDKVARHKIGEQILSVMKKYEVPGGQLCIVKSGRVIYMGAFGFADGGLKTPVSHDNLFRVASIRKHL